MKSPEWIDPAVVRAVHDRQIREHGGVHGIRSEALLESALNAPKNRFDYAKAEICELAAAYAYAIAVNHPFVDGNKRTAYICMRLFLRLNGRDFTASGAEKVALMMGVASGGMTVEAIAGWLKEHGCERQREEN
jgi:death-on-curing protein